MANSQMKIKAIAPWFGGKRNLASRIVELLGPHRVYWEPFCGSMAVLMAKPACEMETVNDLHGDLINLAKVIQDSAASRRQNQKHGQARYGSSANTDSYVVTVRKPKMCWS